MLGRCKRVDLVPTVEEQERKQHRDADGVHGDHDPGIGLSPYVWGNRLEWEEGMKILMSG